MKMLNNIIIGLLILLGIGLMTQGNQWGSACIVVSIFYSVFLLYKRKQIKHSS
ncbi:hypothetical protein BACPU_13820 [Bacillus pumilus]|nr:hypothetical protein BACPU_13820 [Bacillus pumilus]